MKILFCASNLHSLEHKSRQRLNTLRELGYHLLPFNLNPYHAVGLPTRLRIRLARTKLPAKNHASFNHDFLARVAGARPDVVWMEKALLLLPETIARARAAHPNACWVSFQDDNPFGLRTYEARHWEHFKACIPLYDIHFVKRQADIANFTSARAQRVAISPTGYYSSFHYPRRLCDVPPSLRHDVLFIGTAIDDRVAAMSHLLNRARLPVHVYGDRWNRYWLYYLHRSSFHPHTGPAYPLLVSGAKLILGYVSSSNLDEYSGRSVDVPACGGFLLAQRTPTHCELYDEGREAEFFDSGEECAAKIRFYLAHESSRHAIARAGYERSRKADYSLTRRMREVMQVLPLRPAT